jgi:glutamate-5-semialdehyde dehydrogenase
MIAAAPTPGSACEELARRARDAARFLSSTATTTVKNRWLTTAADAVDRATDEILVANATDVERAANESVAPALLDRLRLDADRIRLAANGLRAVADLPDPVGTILEECVRPNGLQVNKVGVPLGVIFFIYEARPNVTVDAAGLCVKSGNAVLLRGGHEAQQSNAVLVMIMRESLGDCGLPLDLVQLVSDPDRAVVGQLLRLEEYIDLVIPRGGESLIRYVAREARMPVLKHYKGNCHVYVERSADPEMAIRILLNSKCQRPGVCNAAESLLVDRAIAESFLPRAAAALRESGVELRGCPITRSLVPQAHPATEQDFAAEYLDLILSIKVIDGPGDAVAHINRYGSKHTDTIVTRSKAASRVFTEGVDSAVVLVNASTRFNDGFELGLGAEIGISTDKFHARGPCGLKELTSYKYIVQGNGQVR